MKKLFYLLTSLVLLVGVFTTCNKDAAVKGVNLDESSLTLEIGKMKTLIATVLPEKATNKAVLWVSTNPLVATVSSNGLVTAISKGKATIEVTTVDGSFSARCIVTVTVPPTPEELLTQDKGWQLTAGTCNPPYESIDGKLISNLFEGFLYDCELDDIVFFYKNYSQYLNYGKILCDWESGIGINLGKWRIRESENVLEFQLSYFLETDDTFAKLEGTIVVLDENTLKLDIPITFDDGTKLAKRGLMSLGTKATKDYVFTLTYSKVSK
jgi:hypothetical protein